MINNQNKLFLNPGGFGLLVCFQKWFVNRNIWMFQQRKFKVLIN